MYCTQLFLLYLSSNFRKEWQIIVCYVVERIPTNLMAHQMTKVRSTLSKFDENLMEAKSQEEPL